MGALFLVTWATSSVAGWRLSTTSSCDDHEDPVTWASYLGHADLWNRTFQNWQWKSSRSGR